MFVILYRFGFARWVARTREGECPFLRKILVVPFSLFRGSPHTEKFVYFILNHFLLIFVVIFKGGFPQIKS